MGPVCPLKAIAWECWDALSLKRHMVHSGLRLSEMRRLGTWLHLHAAEPGENDPLQQRVSVVDTNQRPGVLLFSGLQEDQPGLGDRCTDLALAPGNRVYD